MARLGAVALAVMAAALCSIILEAPVPVAAVLTCGQVVPRVLVCTAYVRGNGRGPVPPACCNGVRAINNLARTTADRRAACNCLQAVVRGLGVNAGTLSGLPGRCGVGLPFTISPNMNCNRIP